MLPIVKIPETIRKSFEKYRPLFCRKAGFEHVGRYITGLIINPNKTLQGIHDAQVWPEGNKVSCRTMHEGIFEANWQSENLMPHHREVVGKLYQKTGRYVRRKDWTLSHHDFGAKIYGVKKGYDYVKGCYGNFQTVLTATVSNATRLDGIEVEVQHPESLKKEKIYLKENAKQEYENLEEAHARLLELLHYESHCKRYKKITEIAVDVVTRIEDEGHFPEAHYAFDNGVLNLPLCQLIESRSKHWVSELESSRNIMWHGQWQRIDFIASELRNQHPQSFRPYTVSTRTGGTITYWCFTKAVRLKKYGKKRILIAHEKEDLSDTPRFIVTSAIHWEGSRILNIWNYRWSSEIFHEFSKQNCGFESAQLRKEEAVKRHFRLSCVAQTILQNLVLPASTLEKFKFAQGQITQGQRERKVIREVLQNMLAVAQQAFAQGKTHSEVLNLLIPA